jgi:hypothetical protein
MAMTPQPSPQPAAKPVSVQTYQLILYRRALHPELFTLKGRRSVRHNAFELEAWLMPAAHLLRFSFGGFSACELVTFQEDGLPTEGAVATFPCAGEHDFEHRFGPERVNYMTTVQTETLSENLYNATYMEMLDFARETEAMVHRWNDGDGGRCMSLVEIQRFAREVHIQAYHLIAQGGFVLRTQSIFEHR